MVRECLAVGRAEGAKLDDGHRGAGRRGRAHARPPTRSTRSSPIGMAGRPMEIDARNGAVVRFGRKHGIPTPLNEMAVALLVAAQDVRSSLNRARTICWFARHKPRTRFSVAQRCTVDASCESIAFVLLHPRRRASRSHRTDRLRSAHAGDHPRLRRASAEASPSDSRSPPFSVNCSSVCCSATCPGLANSWSVQVRGDPMIGLLAGVGAVVLLFEVGLESTLRADAARRHALARRRRAGRRGAVGARLPRRTRAAARPQRVRARLPRGHAHGDERRHHGARAQGSRPGADRSRRGSSSAPPSSTTSSGSSSSRSWGASSRPPIAGRRSRSAPPRSCSPRRSRFLVGAFSIGAFSSPRALHHRSATAGTRHAAHHGARLLLPARVAGVAHRPGADRRGVRGGPDSRGGALHRLRGQGRAPARGAGAADLGVPRARSSSC